MADKPTITTLGTNQKYSASTLNSNFTALRNWFDNVLGLGGDSESNNTITGDVDFNGNQIKNAVLRDSAIIGTINGVNWTGAWITATVYAAMDLVFQNGNAYICLISHTAGTFATDLAALKWEIFAKKGSTGSGSGDLIASNDLSDVDDAPTALGNLAAAGTALANIFTGACKFLFSAATGVLIIGRSDTHGDAVNAGILAFQGKDDGGSDNVYARIRGFANQDAAGTTQGWFVFETPNGGVIMSRWNLGTQIWSENVTGGAKGNGTINCEDYYKKGNLLPIQTIFESSAASVVAGAESTNPHGLGVIPKVVQLFLKCTKVGGVLGYSENDLVLVSNANAAGSGRGYSTRIDITNIITRFGIDANPILLVHATTGAIASTAVADWDFLVRAFA